MNRQIHATELQQNGRIMGCLSAEQQPTGHRNDQFLKLQTLCKINLVLTSKFVRDDVKCWIMYIYSYTSILYC